MYSGTTLDVERYDSVTITIWLGKGVHHWFFCPDSYDETLTTVCQSPGMQYAYPKTNNVQFIVRALDCYERTYYFKDFAAYGSSSIFDEQCARVTSGEKPQIRVANEYSLFNVTNHARFQDLEFDGLDMLVSSECDWSYVPTQKCQY